MDKDLQTMSFLAKASGVFTLVRELEVSYQQWQKTHKEPMTQEDLEELIYLISNSANTLDNIGMDAQEVQKEKVQKLSKPKCLSNKK